MHTQGNDLGREETLDHAEERQELLAALEPHDEIRPEHLDLVVLEHLPVDPRNHPGRVHDDEVRPHLLGLFVQGGHPRDDRQQVALRRRGADERQRVGARERLRFEVLGPAQDLQRDRGGRPDRLLADVRVQERRGTPSRAPLGAGPARGWSFRCRARRSAGRCAWCEPPRRRAPRARSLPPPGARRTVERMRLPGGGPPLRPAVSRWSRVSAWGVPALLTRSNRAYGPSWSVCSAPS